MITNPSSFFAAVLGACTCAAFTACSSTPPRTEPPADDGLVRVETAMLDELYVAPNVSLANYQRVMLDPIEFNFKDGWRSQHPDMDDREFEVFRTRLTDMLREQLVSELAKGGYQLAEAPDKDVLRLHASVGDVEFGAPETGVDKVTSVYVDGKMTLNLQGFDAPSGALVARAKDHEEDYEQRHMQRADRVSAMLNAKLFFEKWAQELRSALDVAKVQAGARKPQQ
ncbi:MAG TPA: DUF3313 family protein [Steroidobacteraceae bacterium]|nr:DUF3313 family protein [Steroidobacteraceae bacterium]